MKVLFFLASIVCTVPAGAQNDEKKNLWAVEAGIGGNGVATQLSPLCSLGRTCSKCRCSYGGIVRNAHATTYDWCTSVFS